MQVEEAPFKTKSTILEDFYSLITHYFITLRLGFFFPKIGAKTQFLLRLAFLSNYEVSNHHIRHARSFTRLGDGNKVLGSRRTLIFVTEKSKLG